MTFLGILSASFFLLWLSIFIGYSIRIFSEKQLQSRTYQTLWVINLGSGIGILLYNYEIEGILQSYLINFPLSVSSLRVFIGNIIVILSYYLALKRLSKVPFPNWIFKMIWGHFIFVVLLDFCATVFFDMPYREYQIWMSLVIIPFSLLAAKVVSPSMKMILQDERSRFNRARFLWWLVELSMATLSATVYLLDAIYRVMYSNYQLYTVGTLIAITLYNLLIISALCRVVLPQNIIEIILYPEKVWVYYRLRRLCKHLHKQANLPEMYRYQNYFYPTLYNLDREISRSIISISDVSRLLPDNHYSMNSLAVLRNPEFTTEDTIKHLINMELFQ